MAARDPDTYDWTVRHGLGVMATPLSKPDSEVANLAGRFAKALADHPGGRRPAFMVLRRTRVYEDPRDWRLPAETAAEDVRVFNGLFYNAAGVVNGFPTPMDATMPDGALPLTPEALRDNLMFGTPDHVVERIRHYEALGVDHYCYGASFGLPHAVALRSLELFGRHVMPHFTAARASTQ